MKSKLKSVDDGLSENNRKPNNIEIRFIFFSKSDTAMNVELLQSLNSVIVHIQEYF